MKLVGQDKIPESWKLECASLETIGHPALVCYSIQGLTPFPESPLLPTSTMISCSSLRHSFIEKRRERERGREREGGGEREKERGREREGLAGWLYWDFSAVA